MACANCRKGSSTPRGAMKAAKIQSTETTEVRSWTELPLLDVDNAPDDLDLIGGSNKEFKAWRIPAEFFLPGGALTHSQYNVNDLSAEIQVPERQVVPVYTRLDAGKGIATIAKARAIKGETATDVVVARNDGTFTIMKNGYFKFSRPHQYEIGRTYYLSQNDEGQVISDRPDAGIIQPLFSVVDHNTISINVNLY